MFDYNGNGQQGNGSDQSWTVPAGVTSITVKLWGAGGGGSAGHKGMGGHGGFTKGTLAVNPGDTLKLIVGHGGVYNGGNKVGYGFGGRMHSSAAGTGGGGAFLYKNNTLVAVAGGGGGRGDVIALGDWLYFTDANTSNGNVKRIRLNTNAGNHANSVIEQVQIWSKIVQQVFLYKDQP